MRLFNASPRKATRFSEVVRQHMDSLYSAALRMTKNEMDAEDLVQTTCLKALKSFGQLRNRNKAKSWLFQILTNTFINEYRRRIRVPETVELDDVEEMGDVDEAYISWIKTPEEMFFDQEFSAEVEDALDSLHPDIKLVVWYADIEDFSYAEIAQMLSCSEGTVASRLSRGRNQLKKRLKRYAKAQGISREGENDVS